MVVSAWWSVVRGFDLRSCCIVRRVSSCVEPNDRCGRNNDHSVGIWTVWLRCACDNGASIRPNGRIATRSPPSCTCTAFRLKSNQKRPKNLVKSRKEYHFWDEKLREKYALKKFFINSGTHVKKIVQNFYMKIRQFLADLRQFFDCQIFV